MILHDEKIEVRKYLMGKNLTEDVILDIEDHFIQDIENSIDEKGMFFQEAFLETQKKWKKDFRPVKRWMLSLRTIPAIMKEYQANDEKSIGQHTLATVFIAFILQYFLARMVSFETFAYFMLLPSALIMFSVLVIGWHFFSALFIKSKTRTDVFFTGNVTKIILGYGLLDFIIGGYHFGINSFKVFYSISHMLPQELSFKEISWMVLNFFKISAYVYLYWMLAKRESLKSKIKKNKFSV